MRSSAKRTRRRRSAPDSVEGWGLVSTPPVAAAMRTSPTASRRLIGIETGVIGKVDGRRFGEGVPDLAHVRKRGVGAHGGVQAQEGGRVDGALGLRRRRQGGGRNRGRRREENQQRENYPR